MMKKIAPGLLVTLILCYFTEGFVDIVGIATNMVQQDMAQNQTRASLMPSLVFIWFLLISVPSGLVMDRIGRKRMVQISILIGLIALLLPLLGYSFPVILLAMSLMGISHVALQVSLKPMITNVVPGNKLAGMMSFGQFAKAIISFSAPLLAGWGAIHMAGSLGWRAVLPVFLLIGTCALLALSLTPVPQEQRPDNRAGLGRRFADCFSLLHNPLVALTFIAVLCHVGINVGMNITAPKLLMERCEWTLARAAKTSSLYFLMRTISSFCTPFILSVIDKKKYLIFCLSLMVTALLLMLSVKTPAVLFCAIGMIGFGGVNVYPIIFSEAILSMEDSRRNAFSSLMAMAFVGGALFPTLMGMAGDRMGQRGAVLLMGIGAAYLLGYGLWMKTGKAVR